MNREEFLQVVKLYPFFNIYCPEVANFAHKARGLSGNKTPIDFSAEDKKKIKEAAKRLAADLKKLKF